MTTTKSVSLFDLVMARNWKGVRSLLGAESGRLASQRNTKIEASLGGMLHIVCYAQPPQDIVSFIAETFPSDILAVDKLERRPLHIAATFGASSSVIKVLTNLHPESAGSVDASGQTPLHNVCQYYPSRYSEEISGISLETGMLAVAKTLCGAAPFAIVNLEDSHDMTPIEYAIDSEAPLRVVKYLQKSGQKEWRKCRTTGETHVDAEQCLLEEARKHFERITVATTKADEVRTTASKTGTNPPALGSRITKRSVSACGA